MRRLSIGLLVALLVASRVGAQVSAPVSITVVDSGAACSVAAACANFQVGNAPSLTLQVSGTFVGTLTFEATADGTNWTAIGLVNPATGTAATTATAPGQFALPNWGIVRVRVRATAFSSGSASVTMTRGVGTHLSAASGGGGGAALPTAPIGQVLISQGAGVAPVFGSIVTLSAGGEFRIGDLFIGQFQATMPQAGVHAAALKPIPRTYGGPDDQPGELWNLTDSPTSVPGSIVSSGGGTNSVLVRWSGTNYVVIGGVANAPTEPVTSAVSSATPAPVGAGPRNLYLLTAQAATATFAAPTGTPVDGSYLTIRVKDNGTPQTLAWNAIYRAGSVALPLTTTTSKTMYIGFRFNAADTKWDLTALATGF